MVIADIFILFPILGGNLVVCHCYICCMVFVDTLCGIKHSWRGSRSAWQHRKILSLPLFHRHNKSTAIYRRVPSEKTSFTKNSIPLLWWPTNWKDLTNMELLERGLWPSGTSAFGTFTRETSPQIEPWEPMGLMSRL